MTLVLALGNADQCIQVTDRQLTDARGKPFVTSENKATIITLADARLVCGFAGLARSRSIRTAEWMLTALVEAARPDHLAHGTIERFTAALTERFQKPDIRAVAEADRGLSVLFTGYRDVLPPPNLIAALVTNFQNFESGQDEEPWEEFRATFWSITDPKVPREEVTFVQRIGRWLAMEDPTDENVARQALREGRSTEAIVSLGVGLVRKAAGRAEAAGTIGRDLNSAILSAARPASIAKGEFPMYGGYHPTTVTHVTYGVNQVISLPGIGLAMMDPEVRAEDPDLTPPMIVPKVGRNQRCPCGSGKKFKRCHGA